MIRRLMVPAWLSVLLLLPAAPPVQGYSAFFYVIPTSAPLRECANPGCEALSTVYQGDKVEILERTPAGWSKVRLVDKPAAIGWMPSDWLSFSPDLKSVATPTYHVNSESLPLRVHPRPDADVLTTLYRNDSVEMLGVGTSGWAQVRDLKTSVVGWAPPRYLSPGAGDDSAAPPPRRRTPARKAPPKEELAPAKPSGM